MKRENQDISKYSEKGRINTLIKEHNLIIRKIKKAAKEAEKIAVGIISGIRKRLEEAVPDSGTAQKCAESVKAIESRLIPAYVDIMKMVAEHITATGKINYCGEDLAELIKKYINRNFSSKISLSVLSEKFGCSSSTAK